MEYGNIDWPVIKVKAFKRSGKFYGSKETDLDKQHFHHPYHNKEMTVGEAMDLGFSKGNDLKDLLDSNDPSVQKYSPVTSGFGGEFIYYVDVSYPAGIGGFCTYLINV